MSDLSKPTDKEVELAEKISLQLTEPTPDEMIQLGIIFDRILATKNMTRKDWIKENKIKNSDSQLSHLLNGRGRSAHLAQKVCKFITAHSN